MKNLAILCVDDEDFILEFLTEQLSQYLSDEYHIEVALGGAEALSKLETFPPRRMELAVAIADQNMPGLSGDELLIKIHRRHPRAIKIMLTAHPSSEALGKALNMANLYRYIAKPWNETDLILTVREALRRYTQEEQLARKNRELQQLTASLEQIVEERTEALILINEKLHQEIADRRQSEAEFRHIVQNVSSAIVRWSPAGQVLFINDYGSKFFGYEKHEIVGQNLMGKLIPDIETSGRNLKGLIEKICRNPKRYAVHENENIRSNGDRVWVTWVNQPIYDDRGRLTEILSVATDTTERRLAEEALRSEQQKSERLLLNILPQPIAERLKQDEGKIIAEKFDDVTILFADIVGFTPLADRLPPLELVKMLNYIFSIFDQQVELLELEKIKTIGDAYMVVAGLPIPRPDHAEAIADMALSIQLLVDHFQFEDIEPFQVRIGINTGPVVAGVIGIQRFIYDLWGDTVNVASRMESSGEAGKIQVTEATYDRLKDRYVFERRGRVFVKGKGQMNTYWLLGSQ